MYIETNINEKTKKGFLKFEGRKIVINIAIEYYDRLYVKKNRDGYKRRKK
jgi:hypothetical protein